MREIRSAKRGVVCLGLLFLAAVLLGAIDDSVDSRPRNGFNGRNRRRRESHRVE